MAVRPILHYPDKRLRNPGKPVTRFDAELRQLVDDMAETMYAAPGVGLAAPQIGVSLRLFVIDVAAGDDAPSQLRTFINPEIIERSGEVSYEEGCLSFPGVHEEIDRAERVKVRAYDQNGKAFTLEAQGLLAVCIQHEMDHLQGKVFVEHLSQLKQQRIRAKLAKQLRKSA